MTTTRLHGSLPEGIRDHHNVFGEKPDDTPQSRLMRSRAEVARLTREHAEARSTFAAAVEDDGQHDLQAMKSNVARLARELDAATTQQSQWEAVCAQEDRSNRATQFEEKLKEAREARRKFAELFRDACLALGRWYALGSEIHELSNSVSDRLPTGAVYYRPEVKNALAELGENPDPLPALREAGYDDFSTFQSWRRSCAVVPLKKKGE